MTPRGRRLAAAALVAAGAACSAWSTARAADPALSDCHVAGIANGVLCGSVIRPLDPEHASAGTTITIQYIVVPAMARRKIADPVFMLAGGPGQSAVAIAAQTLPLFARLNNRRDIVFVDQRGTGGSAPLLCDDDDRQSLADQSEPDRQVRRMMQCKAELLKLPYIKSESDLGLFTTSIAVQDLDAVRRQLGVERIDLVGGSYGTRAALEYLRQFPKAVRRVVLDGVAPPDMVLPASFSTDNQAAFDSLVAACAATAACARAHPDLRVHFAALLQGLPRPVTATHPFTGRDEKFTLTGDMVLTAVRGALYSPALAAALPDAIDAAMRGDLSALLGLEATLFARKSARLATGMHFSVVCAEDAPRLAVAGDKPGADFGTGFASLYAKVCAAWPRGAVPPAFYSIPASNSPALLLSGGIDPATPPRHAARVARALGPLARHVVVANAGHGVMALGCMRDVVYRFIDAATAAEAMAVDAACVSRVPRPPAFESIRSVMAAASEAAR
jgi:pimeloyl-ACP methyl ester carboxylesterase